MTDKQPVIERMINGHDELGFACLADECPTPKCGAAALIINEWDTAECLSCGWRESGPPEAVKP